MNSFCILRALPLVVPVLEKARVVERVRNMLEDLESIMVNEMGRKLEMKLTVRLMDTSEHR